MLSGQVYLQSGVWCTHHGMGGFSLASVETDNQLFVSGLLEADMRLDGGFKWDSGKLWKFPEGRH